MYVSTKNDSYYLRLSKSQDVVTARLTDYQSKKIHYFAVKETKQKDEVLLDFQYDYTIDVRNSNFMRFLKNEYSLSQDSLGVDSDLESVTMQVYKNSRRKKKEGRFSLDVKKSDNLFSAFEFCCVHPHQFLQNEKPKNWLVTKATETTKKGQLIDYKLKTLKEVSFQLIVPEESKIKYKNSLY